MSKSFSEIVGKLQPKATGDVIKKEVYAFNIPTIQNRSVESFKSNETNVQNIFKSIQDSGAEKATKIAQLKEQISDIDTADLVIDGLKDYENKVLTSDSKSRNANIYTQLVDRTSKLSDENMKTILTSYIEAYTKQEQKIAEREVVSEALRAAQAKKRDLEIQKKNDEDTKKLQLRAQIAANLN